MPEYIILKRTRAWPLNESPQSRTEMGWKTSPRSSSGSVSTTITWLAEPVDPLADGDIPDPPEAPEGD